MADPSQSRDFALEVSTSDSTSDHRNDTIEQPPSPTKLQHALIVIAATTIVFSGPGLLFAYGVFQELYEELSHDPSTPFSNASAAKIDLIGTLSIALMTIGAPFTTSWCKRYRPRLVIWSGGAIFCVASILASFSQSLWQFELTQGLLLGLGVCLSYIPAVTITPLWFNRRRGLAMGIVLAGTGFGGVAWAPALRALVTRIGFRNTLRVAGVINVLITTPAGAVLDWPASRRAALAAENAATLSRTASFFQFPLVDWRVASSRAFLAQALAAFLQSAAYYTPVFFFASYARTLGYSQASSANFIALSNAMNALGKIGMGYVADRAGRLNILFLTSLISAIATLGLWLPSCLSSSQSVGQHAFIAFATLYGIFASAYVGLFTTALVEVFGVQNFPSVNGALNLVRGIATLIGTPVAGLLIQVGSRGNGGGADVLRKPGAYTNMSVLVGTLMATTSIALLWLRFEAGMARPGGAWKWRF